MKKTMALVMAACMAGATLVGCGSSASSAAPAGDSSTSTAASSSDKQVTMDLIWWTDGNETKVMQGLIDEYEQLHPNIKINLQEIAFDDLNTKLQMSIAGGEAPAMSRGTEGTVSQLHDAMVDFSDYIDTDALQSEYLESVDYLYKSDNEVVAIPTEVTANGMIYNKTAFEAAGVEVPTGPTMFGPGTSSGKTYRKLWTVALSSTVWLSITPLTAGPPSCMNSVAAWLTKTAATFPVLKA